MFPSVGDASINHAAVLVCTVGVLFLYLIQAQRARARSDSEDPDHFFLSVGAHSQQEYGSTQIAYFLQMATVYPFFVFGYSKLWWLGFWNTAFWAGGIVLFMLVLPRCTKGLLDMVGRSSTPHALIATVHQRPSLRVFASMLSITAFVGLALFEMVWGTAALRVILGGSSYLYYLTMAVFGLYLISVLWAGGQRAAIRTAQTQLLLSYIGLHTLTAWALWRNGSVLANTDAPFIFGVIILLASVAVYMRLRDFRQDGTWTLRLLNAGAVLSLVAVIAAILRSRDLYSSQGWSFQMPTFPPEAFLMLVAMAALPLLFQFVDMTNWQRLSSLAGDRERVMADARTGLIAAAIESPLSWLFPIVTGMLAAQFLTTPEGTDPWYALIESVTSTQGLPGLFLSAAVVVGFVCVFMSTADALLSAAGYAYAYDIHPATRSIMDRVHLSGSGSAVTPEERALVTTAGKMATSVAIAASVVLYICVDVVSNRASGRLLGLFLAFYSPMLAFAPSMLVPIMTGRTATGSGAFASMAISGVTGISVGMVSVFATASYWPWLAVPACVVLSWVIYLGSFAVSNKPLPSSGPTSPSSARSDAGALPRTGDGMDEATKELLVFSVFLLVVADRLIALAPLNFKAKRILRKTATGVEIERSVLRFFVTRCPLIVSSVALLSFLGLGLMSILAKTAITNDIGRLLFGLAGFLLSLFGITLNTCMERIDLRSK